MKDVLEDKRKKRTITIIGTILIILATAGVFAYEASSIEVSEPPTADDAGGEAGNGAAATEQRSERDYHAEHDGTIQGSSVVVITDISSASHTFPVEEGAKKAVITVSADKDVDLYIYDPDGELVGSSATEDSTETVTLNAAQLSNTGEWEALIHNWGPPNPFNTATYHLVIDVYYEPATSGE